VVVATAPIALDLARRHRADLWPGAAIVLDSVPTPPVDEQHRPPTSSAYRCVSRPSRRWISHCACADAADRCHRNQYHRRVLAVLAVILARPGLIVALMLKHRGLRQVL